MKKSIRLKKRAFDGGADMAWVAFIIAISCLAAVLDRVVPQRGRWASLIGWLLIIVGTGGIFFIVFQHQLPNSIAMPIIFFAVLWVAGAYIRGRDDG